MFSREERWGSVTAAAEAGLKAQSIPRGPTASQAALRFVYSPRKRGCICSTGVFVNLCLLDQQAVSRVQGTLLGIVWVFTAGQSITPYAEAGLGSVLILWHMTDSDV